MNLDMNSIEKLKTEIERLNQVCEDLKFRIKFSILFTLIVGIYIILVFSYFNDLREQEIKNINYGRTL